MTGDLPKVEDRKRSNRPIALKCFLTKFCICRVPGNANDIAALKDQIDSGNYVLTTGGQTPDVRAVAALLKLWIRELPEALIPSTL